MSAARAVACALAALSVASCEGGGGVGSAAPPRAVASDAQASSSPVEVAPSSSAGPPALPSTSGLPEPYRTYYDDEGEPCRLVRVTPRGAVVLLLRGAEQELPLAGIDPPDPLPPAYVGAIELAPRRRPTLACLDWPARDGRPAAVIVKWYVREDKAGPVWDDLSARLLESGLARAAPGELPDKKEYLKREARARAEGRGIWAKPP